MKITSIFLTNSQVDLYLLYTSYVIHIKSYTDLAAVFVFCFSMSLDRMYSIIESRHCHVLVLRLNHWLRWVTNQTHQFSTRMHTDLSIDISCDDKGRIFYIQEKKKYFSTTLFITCSSWAHIYVSYAPKKKEMRYEETKACKYVSLITDVANTDDAHTKNTSVCVTIRSISRSFDAIYGRRTNDERNWWENQCILFCLKLITHTCTSKKFDHKTRS